MVEKTTGVNETILAFDTAMSACSVALYDAGTKRFFDETVPMSRGQAEQLVPMIERVMEQGDASYSDLDRIVTTVGPGAFTGLRIGLSTARALGTALNIPVSGVSTMEVLAHQYFSNDGKKNEADLLVVLETKRKDFYYQLFSSAGGVVKPAGAACAKDISALIAENRSTVVIGDAVSRFYKVLQEDGYDEHAFSSPAQDAYSLINPRAVIKLFHKGLSFRDCDPLYLREADVSQSKKKYRKIERRD